MWHVKIVGGVLQKEPGPLELEASSRSLAELVSHSGAAGEAEDGEVGTNDGTVEGYE